MAITLTPETQRLVEDKLKAGPYPTADEVVLAALETWDELENAEPDDATLDAVDRAEDRIGRGEVHGWTDVRTQVRDAFVGRT